MQTNLIQKKLFPGFYAWSVMPRRAVFDIGNLEAELRNETNPQKGEALNLDDDKDKPEPANAQNSKVSAYLERFDKTMLDGCAKKGLLSVDEAKKLYDNVGGASLATDVPAAEQAINAAAGDWDNKKDSLKNNSAITKIHWLKDAMNYIGQPGADANWAKGLIANLKVENTKAKADLDDANAAKGVRDKIHAEAEALAVATILDKQKARFDGALNAYISGQVEKVVGQGPISPDVQDRVEAYIRAMMSDVQFTHDAKNYPKNFAAAFGEKRLDQAKRDLQSIVSPGTGVKMEGGTIKCKDANAAAFLLGILRTKAGSDTSDQQKLFAALNVIPEDQRTMERIQSVVAMNFIPGDVGGHEAWQKKDQRVLGDKADLVDKMFDNSEFRGIYRQKMERAYIVFGNNQDMINNYRTALLIEMAKISGYNESSKTIATEKLEQMRNLPSAEVWATGMKADIVPPGGKRGAEAKANLPTDAIDGTPYLTPELVAMAVSRKGDAVGSVVAFRARGKGDMNEHTYYAIRTEGNVIIKREAPAEFNEAALQDAMSAEDKSSYLAIEAKGTGNLSENDWNVYQNARQAMARKYGFRVPQKENRPTVTSDATPAAGGASAGSPPVTPGS